MKAILALASASLGWRDMNSVSPFHIEGDDMKCVCPMGGDRTCPDDCPLATWANLSPADRKAQRKPVAEALYKQGFTQEQIATQLGVNQATIARDLSDLCTTHKTKPAKTATNPKGAGRPKGSGKRGRRHKPRDGQDQAAALLMLDEGKSRVEAAQATGLRQNVVQLSMERELGRRETLNQLLDAAAAANFSEKGKLKIEDAIRIHKARLDKQFAQRVNDEVIRRIAAADDAARERNKQLLRENINLQRIVGQRGLFTKTQFRQLQMLCHPDNSASPQLRAQLSQILVENEVRIVKPERV